MSNNQDPYSAVSQSLEPAPDPSTLLIRVLAGDTAEEVTAWMTDGLRRWVRADGSIDLHRAFGLPPTPWRVLRDYWLRQAATALADSGETGDLSAPLADEWNVFVLRCPWRRWRDVGGPPADASPLRAALFRATVAAGGKTLGARQLRNVLGNFSGEKFPQDAGTMVSIARGSAYLGETAKAATVAAIATGEPQPTHEDMRGTDCPT
jgi:hypothetical protein